MYGDTDFQSNNIENQNFNEANNHNLFLIISENL